MIYLIIYYLLSRMYILFLCIKYKNYFRDESFLHPETLLAWSWVPYFGDFMAAVATGSLFLAWMEKLTEKARIWLDNTAA